MRCAQGAKTFFRARDASDLGESVAALACKRFSKSSMVCPHACVKPTCKPKGYDVEAAALNCELQKCDRVEALSAQMIGLKAACLRQLPVGIDKLPCLQVTVQWLVHGVPTRFAHASAREITACVARM